jgi:glycosyltransferase involved in cell wall biosynthesis
MKEVVKEREDIHLYILGSGPEKEHILNLIDKYKLNSFITLLPSKQNPFKYMNACDGFILESRYEGQGMSILEAKVLGLDIYIPERIEEYNGYNIKGTKDIVSALIKAKKNEDKEIDTMDKYNEDIENKLEDLFKVEN